MNITDKLYIGHTVSPGFTRHRTILEDALLDRSDLLRHMFICGATGFGKTVLGKTVVEEFLVQGIPSIVVDLKGDLSSLAIPAYLTQGNLADETREILGSAYDSQAEYFSESCAGSEIYKKRSFEFYKKSHVRILTPKSEAMEPIALASFPMIDKKYDDCDKQEKEDFREILGSFSHSFLARVYAKPGAAEKHLVEKALLDEILEYAWRRGENIEGLDGLKRLVHWIMQPPITTVGALPVDVHIVERDREKLARLINSRLVGTEQSWYTGPQFELARFLSAPQGKTPILIINLSHLHEFYDQSFVVAQICYSVYRWMRSQGGSSDPRLLLFLDEIGGGGGREAFYPAYPHNPPSKAPLSILVKQGRSFGVCCLLSTQNALDVDHRGLANVQTWAIGNLASDRERKKIETAVSDKFRSVGNLSVKMSSLNERQFLLRSVDGSIRDFELRRLYSAHHSLSTQELPKLGKFIREYQKAQPDISEELSETKNKVSRFPSPEKVENDSKEPINPPSSIPLDPSITSSQPEDIDDEKIENNGAESIDATVTVDGGDESEFLETRTTDGSAASWTLKNMVTGEHWELSSGQQYTIGRYKACDIVIKDRAISRRHFIIQPKGSKIEITADEAGKNLAYVGDSQLGKGETRSFVQKFEIHIGESILAFEILT